MRECAALVYPAADVPPAVAKRLSSWSPSWGDDCDWVAFIPYSYPEPAWAAEGSPFGCCNVYRVESTLGFYLLGCHS